VFADGRRIFRDEADESVVEKWKTEDKWETEEVTYSLKELSDLISPHLTKGTIEFVAVANEKNRYAYCDRLVIRSDGSAKRESYLADACDGRDSCPHGVEDYVPETKKRAA
jgi:hypothetical protein